MIEREREEGRERERKEGREREREGGREGVQCVYYGVIEGREGRMFSAQLIQCSLLQRESFPKCRGCFPSPS